MNRTDDNEKKIIEKIQNTFLIYGKSINVVALDVWLDALERFDTQDILDAFDCHVNGKSIIEGGANHSRYAPKPVHIIEHINAARQRRKSFEIKKQSDSDEPCDPEIAKAWHVFLSHTLNLGVIPDINPEMEMTLERAIEICNREAARLDRLDVIPAEYRLSQHT